MTKCPFCNAPLNERDLAVGQCHSCGHTLAPATPDRDSSPAPPASSATLRIDQTLDTSVGGLESGDSAEVARRKGTVSEPEQRSDRTIDSSSSVDQPPLEPGRKTEDQRNFLHTIQSSGDSSDFPQQEGKCAESERPSDRTIDSSSSVAEPPIEPGRKTDAPRHHAQTLQTIDSVAASAEQGGTQRSSQEQRPDQTIDSAASRSDSSRDAGRKTDAPRQYNQTIEATGEVESIADAEARKSPQTVRVDRTLDSSGSVEETPQKTARPMRTLDGKTVPPDVDKQIATIWSKQLESDATPNTSLKATGHVTDVRGKMAVKPRVVRHSHMVGPEAADYELMDKLGEGGMGVVMMARQAAIDRLVAVKMLKPSGAKDTGTRLKFLAEAAVTGELEHPNIVPIYDMGTDEAGTLFYCMKRVKGKPWSKEVRKKSFPENIEILMKVSDAVAFAHSREVIHRDLKPENVMLGDFGEVLLMDWGLAMSVHPGQPRPGMAGTPAYMAPEMAFGSTNSVGIPSDIYLLGAILFEILTGDPPHEGQSVRACLANAARNVIRPTDKTGELMGVAMKAMATEPKDRYATVSQFQDAIREFQSHSESTSLSARAAVELEEAEREENYETFARARFAFEEAYELWDGNGQAREGFLRASEAYARSALRKGDYDLGASLLIADDPQHQSLLEEISAARQERDARQQRLKTAKRIGAGLVATTLVVITVAFFWIRAEADNARKAEGVAEFKRREAVQQREIADRKTREAQEQRLLAQQQAEIARQQKKIAEQQTDEAVRQKGVADQQRSRAEIAQRSAETARKQEEYGAYIARIGLAAAKIDERAFDRALALLQDCPAHLRDWEWGRLMHLCTQDVRTFDAQQPIDAVALSADGKRLVTGGWGGIARIWDVDTGKQLVSIQTGGQYVFAAAFSPDGRQVATGTNERPDYLKVWDAETGKLIRAYPGHRDAVLSVAYSRDGKRLLTSSYDETARLWELESGTSAVFQGHEWWVWSAAFSPDEQRIVTTCQDGSVRVWSVQTRQSGPPFQGHVGPVYSARFSPDGKIVASGGYDRRILLWDPDKVRPFEFGSTAGQPDGKNSDVFALEGNMAAVRSLQYSANGQLLLSGGQDNTVRVWDAARRKLLKTMRGHAGYVQSCCFAPDSEWVLSGSHDHMAKLWSIAGYEETRVLQGRVLEGHRDAVLDATFSPDGQKILSASRDRSAKLWNALTGKEIRQFKEGHAFLVTRALFFPDSRRIVTSAVDNTTRIWDVATGTQSASLEHSGTMGAVDLSRDGKLLLTGSDDKSAKVWDAESGRLIRKLEGHRSEITAVAISPDGRLFFTADARGRCRLWDVATGNVRWEAEGHSRNVTAACFLPAGDAVLTASTDKTVAQWDVATGKERLPWILKHPDSVVAMALSPDGRRVLTACADRTLRLWDVASGSLVGTLPGTNEATNAVAFSPDGKRAASTTAEGGVRIWDVEQLREVPTSLTDVQTGQNVVAELSPAWSAIYSPDGTQLLTVGGNEACLWNLKTGQQGMRFSPHSSVASADFSPDGTRVVTGSWDNTARIWQVETGIAQLRLEGAHTQFINDARFSPDGTRVVTASDDKTACIWDAKTGKVLQTLRGHEQRVTSAAWSADGTRILTTSNDKTARIWDATTGKQLLVLQGHQQAVLHGEFSRDGKRIVTGGEDNQAKLWDASTGKELPYSLQGHTASVTSVAFSPNGHRVITGSQDQTAKIWDADTGKEILTLRGHSRELTTVGFSPDGRNALTGSWDGTLILWLASDWTSPPEVRAADLRDAQPSHTTAITELARQTTDRP